MNILENAENQPSFRVDPPQPDTGGLLRTGVFSLFFHLALIGLLIFSLKTGTTRNRLTVYRVSIQPLSFQSDSKPLLPKALPAPTPAKPQIQKEEMKPKEEVKKSEPVKETKQLKEDDQTMQKPIPLPMAETSDLKADSKPEEEIVSIPKDASAKSGTGTGTGGSPGGSGEGGAGGAGWTGIGEGTGIARAGGSGFGGSGFVGSGSGGSGTGTGRGRGGSGSPKYAENPKPPYPQEARDKGYQGTVRLKVEVLPDGRVGEIELKESCGYSLLDQSALTTVKKWRFVPATKGKTPIACWVIVPITFQLKDTS